MNESQHDPHVLKPPASGPPPDLSPEAAYLAAVTSLPRLIHEQTQVLIGLVNELMGVHDKLDVISLYYERKGSDEKLFGPDDFKDEDSPNDKEEAGE
jgi:hypothetical protein